MENSNLNIAEGTDSFRPSEKS
jgi:hypothetical protein